MTKKITFPRTFRTPPPAADAWVSEPGSAPGGREPAKPAAGRTRKLTVDVPDDLYRRVRIGLAKADRNLTEFVRELLTREFGPNEDHTGGANDYHGERYD